MAQTYGQKYKQVIELLNSYIKVNYDTKFTKDEQEIVNFFVGRFDTDIGHLRENHILNDKDFYTKGVKRVAQNIVDSLIALESLNNPQTKSGSREPLNDLANKYAEE